MRAQSETWMILMCHRRQKNKAPQMQQNIPTQIFGTQLKKQHKRVLKTRIKPKPNLMKRRKTVEKILKRRMRLMLLDQSISGNNRMHRKVL